MLIYSDSLRSCLTADSADATIPVGTAIKPKPIMSTQNVNILPPSVMG